MGYSTDFTGRITVKPTLNADLQTKINKFCEERHDSNTDVYAGFPGFWCDLMVTSDEEASYIWWNGNEKSYDMAAWMRVVIDNFLAAKGFTCNGEMEAQGEENSDRWLLKVTDNKVTTHQADHIEYKTR